MFMDDCEIHFYQIKNLRSKFSLFAQILLWSTSKLFPNVTLIHFQNIRSNDGFLDYFKSGSNRFFQLYESGSKWHWNKFWWDFSWVIVRMDQSYCLSQPRKWLSYDLILQQTRMDQNDFLNQSHDKFCQHANMDQNISLFAEPKSLWNHFSRIFSI